MPEPLTQALHDWQNFYFMVGTASATLMGLLFVAVSLGTHLVAAREGGVRTFVTPTLVHLTLVLLIAMVMMIPTHSMWSLGSSLLVVGVASTAYCLQVILQMARGPDQETVERAHWVWHATLPLISYITVIGAAVWLLAGSVAALDGLAVSAILLLIVGIHNAWDLVLWLARNR